MKPAAVAISGAGAPRPVTRSEAALVALLALAVYLLTTRGLGVADNLVQANVAIGLATRGSPALPVQSVETRIFADRGPDGRIYASLPPGGPLLATPLVWLGHQLGRLTGGGDERLIRLLLRATLQPNTTRLDPKVDTIALWRRLNRDPRIIGFALLDPLAMALTLFFFLRCTAVLGLPRVASLFGVAILALGTPLLSLAGTCWSQPPVAAALMGSLLALIRFIQAPRWRSAAACGAGLGVAVLVRVDQLPLAAAFGLGLLVAAWRVLPWRRVLGLVGVFCAPLVVAVLVLVGWNLIRFGQWLDPLMVGGRHGRFVTTRFGAFGTPVREGGLGLLFSPLAGILWYAPMLLFAPLGGRALWRRQATVLVLAVGTLLFAWLFYARWYDWSAAMSYGPRYLLPTMPLVALLVVAALVQAPRWRWWVAGALGGLGLLVQLPGALQSPYRFPPVGGGLEWRVFPWLDGWQSIFTGQYVFRGEALGSAPRIDSLAFHQPVYALLVVLALGGAVFLIWRRRGRST